MASLDPADLGRRLRQVRERLGWSLAEVSKRTGLSRAYINALELGRGKRPGAEAVRRLEDVLGPLRPAVQPQDLPPGLGQLVLERNLPEAEARLLAGLRVRGKQPESLERWRFIYDALVSSETIDQDARRIAAD